MTNETTKILSELYGGFTEKQMPRSLVRFVLDLYRQSPPDGYKKEDVNPGMLDEIHHLWISKMTNDYTAMRIVDRETLYCMYDAGVGRSIWYSYKTGYMWDYDFDSGNFTLLQPADLWMRNFNNFV